MDDTIIIKLYFERNEQAIYETDSKYGHLCFTIAFNVLDSIEDSDECVNDTYFSLWNTIPPTKPNNFMAFICKVTKNLALKQSRYKNAAKRNPDFLIPYQELENVLADSSIAANISNADIGQLISTFLRGEKPEIRNIFIRKYWFMESISDIATRYSYSESKVKNLLFHTRNKLRKYLRKEGIAI